jgi:hypothetical protein
MPVEAPTSRSFVPSRKKKKKKKKGEDKTENRSDYIKVRRL